MRCQLRDALHKFLSEIFVGHFVRFAVLVGDFRRSWERFFAFWAALFSPFGVQASVFLLDVKDYVSLHFIFFLKKCGEVVYYTTADRPCQGGIATPKLLAHAMPKRKPRNLRANTLLRPRGQ